MKSLICEGLDRLGKSSLVEGIQQKLGHFNVLHYQKPKLLSYYQDDKINSLKKYQEDSFESMFKMLACKERFILDRAHLGELVYSKRYRGYDGGYVFDLEQKHDLDHTLLVLLVNFDHILEKKLIDDGQSFDWNKRQDEQNDFIEAFSRSSIKNKIMINVGNNGDFVSKEEILNKVVRLMK